MTEEHTIASPPPARADSPRRSSKWDPTLAEARQHPGEWRRLAQPMTKSTVVQVASDLRHGLSRAPEKRRIKAVRAGDVWESAWGHDPSIAAPDAYFLWIKWTPEAAW